MITKEIAVTLTHGQLIKHVSLTNKDGTPFRVRVSGKCKTWIRKPSNFRLPVKRGLYQSSYITELNGQEWEIGL